MVPPPIVSAVFLAVIALASVACDEGQPAPEQTTFMPTASPAPMLAEIAAPTPLSTQIQTPTPTSTPIFTPTPTTVPTQTPTTAFEQPQTPTPTFAPTRTPTPTSAAVPTPTPASVPTWTPTPASVPTPTPTAAPVTTTTLEPPATPAPNSTQTAKISPPPTYLTEEIPPCTPVTGSSVDPCESRSDFYMGPDNRVGSLGDFPVLVEDLVSYPVEVFTTHVALRGTYIPGTVRCTSGHPGRAPSYLGRGQSSSGLLIYCFADVRVNAYLLGTGPSTLTVTVYTSLYQSVLAFGGDDEDYGLEQLESRRLAYERALSEGGRFQYNPPLRGFLPPGGGLRPLRREYDTLDEAHEPNGPAVIGPPGGIGGREAVLFIGPSYRASVEAWMVFWTWDVERREDGVVVALHPYRHYFDTRLNEHYAEMELPALTQAVTTAHRSRVAANGGRIGEDTDLPMLETDANRLRQYFSDPKVGGYAPGVPAPAQPPPPCGLAVPDQGDNPGLMRDCMALLAAKDTLAGTATLDWSVDSAITDWEGVTVAGTPSRVTKVLLSNESLSGSIPVELGDLSELTHLNLSSNSLTGEIPRELGGLSNLQEIRLSGNSLTGCIPAPLKEVPTNDLGSLNLLYCPPAPEGLTAGTVAEGRVPLSWTAVSNAGKYRVEYRLRYSDDWVLDDDTLIGVSHTVDGLTCRDDYLFRVSAYGNGAVHAAAWSDPSDSVSVTTGECVPPTFGAASYSFSLAGDADVGSAVGSVSATGSLADDTVTYSITAGDEGGKFAIDDSTGRITVAGDLNSSVGTSFTLTVEASDTSGGSATVTVTVAVTKTCDSGTAVPNPAGNPGLVADCKTLLGLQSALAGTATLNWSADRAMDTWDGVSLGGTPRRVTRLVLDQKELTGSIPEAVGGLAGLRDLWLSSNELTGRIPDTLAGLTDLDDLRLNNNRLTGPIPPEIGALTNLELVSLYSNALTGPIPPEIGSLTDLHDLWLQDNALTGPIPPELGNLTALIRLWLSDNRLNGTIPAELAGLTNLTLLLLSGNPLVGCVPPSLKDVDFHDLDTLGLTDCQDGPPSPAGLSASLADGAFTLTWTALSGVDEYEVQWQIAGAGDPWVALPAVTTANATYSPAGGPKCSSTYEFRVRAHGDGFTYPTHWGTESGSESAATSSCPPSFDEASYSFEVVEDAAVGDAVGTVSATDPDEDDDVELRHHGG